MFFIRKNGIILLLLGLFIVVYGVVAFAAFTPQKYHSPDVEHPLGDRVEYVGKEDYGCTRGYCGDTGPGSTYYYATDMSVEQVIAYFKKAKKASVVREPSVTGSKVFFGIRLSSGETLYTYYYTDGTELYQSHAGLKQTSKPYFLEVPGSKYQALGDSL